MAEKDHGSKLVVSGVVQGVRDWTTKDTPPQAKRTIDVGWFGGHHEVTVDATDPAFSKLGEGQEVTLAVPFVEHPRFGWRSRGAPVLLKGGA